MSSSSLINNKLILYTGSQYFIYGLQALVGFLMAGKLGPYYLGIYGMVTLILGYLNQFHFGISNSLNVFLVHHKIDKDVSDNYIGNSLFVTSIISSLIILLYVGCLFFHINIDDKYKVDSYLIWIVIIATSEYFNSIFTCILRVRNKLNHISIYKIIYPIIGLFCVIAFSGEKMIYYIVVTRALSQFLLFFIAVNEKIIPPFNRISLSTLIVRDLFTKGIYLFLYNSCFYFIIISTRTIICHFYSVREYGLFTFSYTVANAIMMLFSALSFAIFPKMIDKLSSDNNEELKRVLSSIYHIYVPSIHLLIYLAMLLFPLVPVFFPQYAGISVMLNLIALTAIMQSNSFGYSSMLIAKNMEKRSAFISFTSMTLNVFIALVLVNVLKLESSYVIIASLLAFLYMSWAMCKDCLIILREYSFIESFRRVISLRLIVPFILSFAITLVDHPLFFILPLIAFVLLNYQDIIRIWNMTKTIVRSPNITDV